METHHLGPSQETKPKANIVLAWPVKIRINVNHRFCKHTYFLNFSDTADTAEVHSQQNNSSNDAEKKNDCSADRGQSKQQMNCIERNPFSLYS